MMLRRRTNIVNYAPLLAASAGLLGTTQPVPIDRQWPLEEIEITLLVTAGSTGPTFASATTNAIVDNILGLLKTATLTINDGREPRTIFRMSGAGIVEYASNVGLNVPSSTRAAIALSQGSSVANNLKFRIKYRIPLVHPQIAEPLRTRMLLPIHTYPQDPILLLEFANTADFASAGTIAGLICEVRLRRRLMPDSVTQQILGTGGFINFDIIETPFPIATGASGETNFDVPLGGQYGNLMFRTYLGGSTVTRDVLDAVTTLGSETKWVLISGQVTQEEFRMRNLKDVGDEMKVLNLDTQATSPDFAGAIASGTRYQPASSVMLDFLSCDTEESADELGSLLDCNIPANSGLKMQLRGSIASVATVGSTLYMIGHRWYGDLSKWQAVRY